MKYFLTIAYLLLHVASVYAVKITEENYLGKPHFVIKTKTAVYYLDKAGGVISGMYDKKGRDWISFKTKLNNKYSSTGISLFRGLPGFVSGKNEDDKGIKHPGYDYCYSFKVDNRTILTISKNGNWQWRWEFYNKYARVTIEKIPPESKYWFVFGGTIAGKDDPDNQYWGNNLGGPRNDVSDLTEGKEILGNWMWAYFGDKEEKGVLFVSMIKPDRHLDGFAYINNKTADTSANGMAIFSFGRHSNQPQLTRRNNSFIFGIIWERVKNPSRHDSVQKELRNIFKSLHQ